MKCSVCDNPRMVIKVTNPEIEASTNIVSSLCKEHYDWHVLNVLMERFRAVES